jgi:protein-S-isoprenylcysteine O-methyltransferase Ste14
MATALVVIRFKFSSGIRKSPPRSQYEPRCLSSALGMLAILLGIVLFVALFQPNAFPMESLNLPMSLRFAGIALAFMGLLLMYWSLVSLGKNFSGSSGTHSDTQLCDAGPYQFMRHPYYTATLLLSSGLSIAVSSWVLFVGSLLLFALLSIRSRAEEQELTRQFPDAYAAMQRRTGRFIPKLF